MSVVPHPTTGNVPELSGCTGFSVTHTQFSSLEADQNGISRDTGLPDTWSLDTKENVLWSDDLGGRATPIIMNNRVYLNCRTKDPLEGAGKINLQEQVICRDLETGKVLWQDKFNVFQTDIPAPRCLLYTSPSPRD